MVRFLASIILALGIGYLALLVLVFFYQRHLLFLPEFPSRQHEFSPEDIGLEFENIRLSTQDKHVIHGWWVGHPESRGTVLFFHGNAGNIGHRLETIRMFYGLGFQFMIIDYRGYGRSSGTPSERGLYLDADAAWRHLNEQRRIPPEKIVIAGRSLGAAVALYLATKHKPRALIMESSFTSVPDIAAIHYGWLPVRLLSKYQFNNQNRIGKIHCPVLLIHSTQDEIIPYSHSQLLYQLAPEPKQLVSLHGGHNDAQLSDYKSYVNSLKTFLDRY